MRLFHRKNDIFCGCKQRKRNEQRNQQKTRKYACDVKKPKNVDVLTKSTKRNEKQPLSNLSSNVKVCNDVFCFLDRTWRSSVSCLSATYLVSYASLVVKQHCHKVRFCGCKQRRRNEQRNQQKARKYACDVKKQKNVDVLTKRKRICMAWI